MKKRFLCTILALLMLLVLLPAFTKTAAAESDPVPSAAAERLHRGQEKEPENTRSATRGDVNVDTPLIIGSNDFVIENGGDTVYRPFTPTETSDYLIYSTADKDTYGYLQDSTHTQLMYDDDSGKGNNFLMNYTLEKDETYYVGVRYYGYSNTGTIPVTIQKIDADDCGEDLKWSYDASTKALTITGTGDMWDFSNGFPAPWTDFRDEIESIELPAGLTYIGDLAFKFCTALKEIAIPDGVTKIGEEAFWGCKGLTELTIPGNVDVVYYSAFSECTGLKTVTIENGVRQLYYHTFEWCTNLETISIPESVTWIGDGTFENCQKLTGAGLLIDPNNTNYYVEDGILFWDEGKILHTYLCGRPGSAFTTPAGVRYILDYAFGFCNLEEITVSDGVKEIGYEAFECCDSLVHITLPDGLETLNSAAFYSCSALQSVWIPDSITAIGSSMFDWCEGLKWVVIPNTVTTVSYYAFEGCTSLTDVYYLGTEQERNDTLVIYIANEPLENATWHYVKAENTVTFDPDGGSAVAAQKVRLLSAAQKPADPKKNGYTFKGWYLGSTPYDFSAPVTEDITLKAKWEKIPAPPKFDGTVTLNPNDVQMNGKTPYVLYNGKAQTPGVIVKDKSGKTLAASKYTVAYRNNTNPGTGYADVTIKSTGAKTSVWFKIYLPATTSTTVENVQNGVRVSWKKVSGA